MFKVKVDIFFSHFSYEISGKINSKAKQSAILFSSFQSVNNQQS